jgi:hypothetical protein
VPAPIFLSGIQNGRSWHYANLAAGGVSVQLSVRAQDGDTGLWVLVYDHDELAREVEKERASARNHANCATPLDHKDARLV